MVHSLQNVYATIVDSTTLIHALTSFHSLRRIQSNSVLYLLCMEPTVYSVMEAMEYDDIYIIAVSELEERYPVLDTILQDTTPKKYIRVLHVFLLHYILHYNPLVHAVQYIDPYTYWVDAIKIQNRDMLTFFVNQSHILPYYIYCPNTQRYKDILQEFQQQYLLYAIDRTIAYSEHILSTSFYTCIELYRDDIAQSSYQTLLFTQGSEEIQENKQRLFFDNKYIVGIYTRYLFFSRYLFSCYTSVQGTYRAKYTLARYIGTYRDEFTRLHYKCTLFGLSLPPLCTMIYPKYMRHIPTTYCIL